MKFDNRFIYYITTIIFILTFASVGTPYISTRAHNTIYLYSTIGIFVSGLLFFIGGKKDVRDTINPGFGIGIPSWIASLISCKLGLDYNHYKLLQLDSWLNAAILGSIKESDIAYYLTAKIFLGRGFFVHTFGFYGALVQTFLTVSILILGIVAFFLTNLNYWKLMREKAVFGYCAYCGLNLGGRYGITHCPNCGKPIDG